MSDKDMSYIANFNDLMSVWNIPNTQPKKKSNYEMVKEFHETFGVLTNDKPTILDIEDQELRDRLIKEEYDELNTAFEEETIYDVAKELCDLLYVIYGTGVSMGIDVDQCFAEVHRSNMTKLDENGNVLRRADGKVIKSALYEPADMKKVLDGI
ncbi:MAG: hypothetical protein P4L79_10955 [Legionella sp.]|uniref:hypothetical protein n=1 Tax=Legionella sp. TaxID=459 RepID=UPI0028426F25|nr:hypothetical protein [Legionella sp.]